MSTEERRKKRVKTGESGRQFTLQIETARKAMLLRPNMVLAFGRLKYIFFNFFTLTFDLVKFLAFLLHLSSKNYFTGLNLMV